VIPSQPAVHHQARHSFADLHVEQIRAVEMRYRHRLSSFPTRFADMSLGAPLMMPTQNNRGHANKGMTKDRGYLYRLFPLPPSGWPLRVPERNWLMTPRVCSSPFAQGGPPQPACYRYGLFAEATLVVVATST
jgi:hypothetical protein